MLLNPNGSRADLNGTDCKSCQRSGLKGQCHEDFAVLDQFWAKIITLRLYSLTKCFCQVTTKISNEFYKRGLTILSDRRQETVSVPSISLKRSRQNISRIENQ